MEPMKYDRCNAELFSHVLLLVRQQAEREGHRRLTVSIHDMRRIARIVYAIMDAANDMVSEVGANIVEEKPCS